MATVTTTMMNAGVCIDAPQQSRSLMALPLNLIALILSYLDDVGDLSRLCRTCRVLNYMTLPQLYKEITLTSYDRIRYRDDLPEGCGSASPFSMGLNAIVTRNFGPLVRSMTMRGEWREDGLEEHARVGRVPDSSMMLNIAVRAAIDKMTGLESFSWELNTKMLETAYIGLSQLPKLHSLTIRFPSSRHPRPTTAIPPMPHLRSLKITDIDPLCYPDDISNLLLQSKKLRALRMHWSPRMREAQEPSVTLHDYFRKCIAAKSPLRLRSLSFQNFYALHTDDFEPAIDPNMLEEISMLNSPGVSAEAFGPSTFIETSWPAPKQNLRQIKSLRHDRIDKNGCEFLGLLGKLERLYFVTPVRDAADSINSPRTPTSARTSASLSPAATGNSAVATSQQQQGSPASTASPNVPLRDGYINMVIAAHGPRLRHLLLPSRWSLPASMIARLVRACPNLEQFALATDMSSFETLSLLIPFLQKLRAIRLLIPTGPGAAGPSKLQSNMSRIGGPSLNVPENARALSEIVDLDDRIYNEALGARLADKEIFANLRIIGLGWKAWELGEFYTIPVTEKTEVWELVSPPVSGAVAAGSNSEATGAGPTNSIETIQETQSADLLAPPTASVLGKRKNTDQLPPPQRSPRERTRDLQANTGAPSPESRQITPFVPSTDGQSTLREDAAKFLDGLPTHLSSEAKASLAQCMAMEPNVGEKVLWRRKVKRVGWDVLQKWEIWGLDAQEI